MHHHQYDVVGMARRAGLVAPSRPRRDRRVLVLDHAPAVVVLANLNTAPKISFRKILVLHLRSPVTRSMISSHSSKAWYRHEKRWAAAATDRRARSSTCSGRAGGG
jgi:hypothetical protein